MLKLSIKTIKAFNKNLRFFSSSQLYTFYRSQKILFANMFKKKQQKIQQQPSFWQSFTSSLYVFLILSTNLRYETVKHFHEIKQKVFEPDEDLKQKFIVIQGKKYLNRSQAKKVVKTILWFSYRKGFKISQNYKSDVGWGCLIRVGQMALASGLLNFFRTESRIKQYTTDQSTVDSIILAFSDFKGIQEKYSLNTIIQIASQLFGHKPGQWFDMTRISFCLQVAQNKRPMRGSQNLQVVFFDQSVNIPKIFKILVLKDCTCAKKNIVCQKCHSQLKVNENEQILTRNRRGQFQTFYYKHQSRQHNMKKQKLKFADDSIGAYNQNTKQSNNPLWIFKNRRLKRDLMLLVLTRVGDPRDVKNVNSAIFTLLDLKICLGIMGGFPGKAIYIVGRQQNKLIYLNPHYVQQNKNISCNQTQSYYCQQYLLTERTQLDPTMNFCFYIQTISDLQLLAKTINDINYRYSDCLSIGVDFGKVPFNPNDYQEEQQASIDCVSNFGNQI